jgi:hypothetical protein
MPRVRYVIPVTVLAALSLAMPAAGSSEPASVDEIVETRQKTWRWQDVMQRKRTPAPLGLQALSSRSAAMQEWALATWRDRLERMRSLARNSPHEGEFRCIHGHEGAWTANTGNGYYGGLQMNVPFQRQYGLLHLRRKGTANNWTPMEQIWTGERALRAGRGFHPWPTAARRCGLI